MRLPASFLVILPFFANAIKPVSAQTNCAAVVFSQASKAEALNYCGSINLLPVVKKNATSTRMVTVTSSRVVTSLATVTPAASTVTVQGTVTQKVTVVPSPTTVTITTLNYQAYVNSIGSTVDIVLLPSAKPSLGVNALGAAAPFGGLFRRANSSSGPLLPAPSSFKQFPRLTSTAICSCLINQIDATAGALTATTTSTRFVTQLLRVQTTLAAPIVTQTQTVTKTFSTVAPAKTAYFFSTHVTNTKCSPITVVTYPCPEGTGWDDGSGTIEQQVTCSVISNDGFSGSCLYWNYDGTPIASTLTLGDGSGDPSHDQSRATSYGKGQNFDCPARADYVCLETDLQGISKPCSPTCSKIVFRGPAYQK